MTLEFDALLDSATHRSAQNSPLDRWAATKEKWLAENGAGGFRAETRGSVLELSILGVIGDRWWDDDAVSAKAIKRKLDDAGDVKTIRVLINSPGGDAFDGLAVQSLLKRHPARVEVEILGWAASAASIIAMAGDSISMHEGSMLMVHEAWTCACGNAKDFRSAAETLDKLNSSMLDVYARRTGRSREELSPIVSAETWMTSHEAVEAKFADAVIVGSEPEPAKDTKAKTKARAHSSSPALVAATPDHRALLNQIERGRRAREGAPSAIRNLKPAR